MLGEAQINLEELVGDRLSVGVHVVDEISHRYEGIIGTDILEKVKGYPRFRSGLWQVKLGKKKYVAARGIRPGRALNAVSIKPKDRNLRDIEIDGLTEKFTDCFYREEEPLTTTGRVEHSIEFIGDKPVFVKPRRYPFVMKEIIRQQLSEMLEQGIIRKSKSPFCSPLWVVPKQSGENGERLYRVVVDYRELNKRTTPEKYPLPRIEDMLDKMEGAKYFSTVDLKSGYHQIRMTEKDIHKTAFSFERGHYEFVRMPFGLRNAPSTFQRLMDECLEGLDDDSTQIYMDDVIVFSKTWTDHIRHLTQLFRRIREFGLKISKEKTKLGRDSVKFMGHVVAWDGIRPNEDRVRAIRDLPIPTNVKAVRTFLGMMGYYRRFIKNFAEITEPLTALLKKGSRVEVSDRVARSVEECKRALCSAPVLKFPNFGRPFIISTDASGEAIGAVLSQVDESGDRPVAFASRKLKPAERRYSTIERELLGVVWAVDHFRPYIFGTTFQIKTDHMPLVWVEKLKETSARITKWKERLAAYQFTIHHTKGSDNVVADCLSRNVNALTGQGEREESDRDLPPAEVQTETIGSRQMNVHPGIVNDKANQLVWLTREQPGWSSEFRSYGHTKTIVITAAKDLTDDEIQTAFRQIARPGKLYYLYVKDINTKTKILKLFEGKKIAQNSEIILCERMVDTVVNPTEQNQIIRQYHVGKTNHRGVNETVDQLKRSYYWINMAQVVGDVLAECDVCQRAKYDRGPRSAPQMLTQDLNRPLQTIYADLFHFDGVKYLSIIDGFTRLAFFYRVKSKRATDIITGLLTYFGAYGLPKEISVDKGREFDNKKFKDLTNELNIATHFTTVGHHRSQSLIERLHSTITEHLHLLKVGQGLGTAEAMPRAVLAYNHTIHSATKQTPLELMLADRLTNAQVQNVRDRVRTNKQRRTETINRRRGGDVIRLLKIGDIVYKKNFYKRAKGDLRYVGPFEILEIMSRHRVAVRKATDPRGKVSVVHVDELKIPRKSVRRPAEVAE